METRCHLGQSIIFDTVERLKWKVDVRKHVIKTVVKDILEGVWWGDDEEEEGGYDRWQSNRRKDSVVPKPIIEGECVVSANLLLSIVHAIKTSQDCYKWDFGDFKDISFTGDRHI